MFAAPERFSHPVPTGLAPPDYSYWRAVELTLRVQWYIVGLRERVDEAWYQRDLLVSWTSDLLDVLRPKDRMSVATVQLMRPVGTPGKTSWHAVTVKKVWTADREPHSQSAIFETSGGDRLCDPMDRVSAGELVDLKLAWQEA